MDVVVEGLRRLEYRGYDSAGVAVGPADGDARTLAKKAGKLANLEQGARRRPAAGDRSGHRPHPLGHPRRPERRQRPPARLRATAGSPLVHNGIIENFAALRTELADGRHHLRSETDTEIVAQLLGQQVVRGVDLADAMRAVCQRLRRRLHPGRGRRARTRRSWWPPAATPRWWSGSGRGRTSSPPTSPRSSSTPGRRSSSARTRWSTITRDGVEITDFDGAPADVRPYHVDWDLSAAEKDGYDWFMRKEIYEQPRAVADTLLGRRDASGPADAGRDADHRGGAAQRRQDHHRSPAARPSTPAWWPSTRSSTGPGSPARSSWPASSATATRSSGRPRWSSAISQSGETADTLMAIRHAREQRARVLAICNTNGSTIPRESDAVIYTHAGPEIGVASTKGFLTQLVACYLLGLYLAQVRGTKFGDEIAATCWRAGVDARPRSAACWTTSTRCSSWPPTSPTQPSVLFLGRHVGYPVALEGALKLKELAYIHAEGFAAGELKHGPIALIEDDLPVFVVIPPRGRDLLHDKVVSNLAGGTRPRRPDHRAGRGGRRRGHAVRRRDDPAAEGVRPCCSRCSPPCRCRCSPASWPPARATTSTSRATWPSRSPSSDRARRR